MSDLDYNKKAIGVVGVVLIVAMTYSTLYASDYRELLDRECPVDSCNYLVIGFEDNLRLDVLTRGASDYLRWLIHKDYIRMYDGSQIAASFDWTVEYYRTYGEDKWVRLYRKPSQIDIAYEPIDDETLLIVKTTPYYAYNYASGTGGLLVEEFVIDSNAVFDSFPANYSVRWIPTEQRIDYDHRLTWRISELEQISDSPSGLIENPEENFVHWFGHNVKVSWEGVFDLVNLAYRDEIEEKLTVYFKPAAGEQLLNVSVVDPTGTVVWLCWDESCFVSGTSENRTYEYGEIITIDAVAYARAEMDKFNLTYSIDLGGYGDNFRTDTPAPEEHVIYSFSAIPSKNEFKDGSTSKNFTYSVTENKSDDFVFHSRDLVSSCSLNLTGFNNSGLPEDVSIFINDELSNSFSGKVYTAPQTKNSFSGGVSSFNLSYPSGSNTLSVYLPFNATLHDFSFNVTGSEGWLPWDYIPDDYSNFYFGGGDYCHDGLAVTECSCSGGDECNSSETYDLPADDARITSVQINNTWSGFDSERIIYLYNHTSSAWVEVDSTTSDSQSYTLSSGLSDYLNDTNGLKIKSGTYSGPLSEDECNDNSLDSSLWTYTVTDSSGGGSSCTEVDNKNIKFRTTYDNTASLLYTQNIFGHNFTVRHKMYGVCYHVSCNDGSEEYKFRLQDSGASHTNNLEYFPDNTNDFNTGWDVWKFNYTGNGNYSIYKDGVLNKTINVSSWDGVYLYWLSDGPDDDERVWYYIDYVRYSEETEETSYLTDTIVRFDSNSTYNPVISVGESGTEDWNYSGMFNDTIEENTGDLSSQASSFLSSCTQDTYGFCSVPIELSSEWDGTVLIDNLNVNYTKNINPVTLDHTLINAYLATQSGSSVDVPLKFESTNGILQVDDIDCDYYGSMDDILINLSFPGGNISGEEFSSSYDTLWFSIRHSNYSVSDAFDFLAFYPESFSDTWVAPYGQSSSSPFWSITPDAYENKFNVSLALAESLDSCVTNVTVSNTSDYSDGVVVNSSNQTILRNLFGYDFDVVYYGETFNDGTLTDMDDDDWVDGLFGNALEFDGSDDHVDIGDLGNLSEDSVSFWFKTDDTNQTVNAAMFSSGGNGGNSPNTFQVSFVDGKIRFYGHNGTSSTEYVYMIDPVLADTWYFVAIVNDGTNTKCYVDGSYVGQVMMGTHLFDDVRVGVNRGDNTYFDGLVDDIRIYNNALSQSEITSIYNSYSQGGAKVDHENKFIRNGLIGYWRFDETEGTTAYDTHHIVTTDNQDGSKYGNALSFDGSNDYAYKSDFWSDVFENDCSNDFSVSVWGKVNKNKDINYWWYVGSDDEPSLKSHVTGAMRACHAGNGDATNASSNCFVSATGVIKEDTWHNAIVTWDHDYFSGNNSGIMRLYVDSVEVGNLSIPNNDSSFLPADDLKVGWDGAAGRDMNGTLDDLRVYSKVLTQTEITDLYNDEDLRDNIVGHLKFNEDSGTTFYNYPDSHLWVWINLDNCDYNSLAYLNPVFDFYSCCDTCHSCW